MPLRQLDTLLHVHIKFCGPFSRDFVELFLFLDSLLIHSLSACDIFHINICRLYGLKCQEILNSLGLGDLRICKDGTEEGSQ